MLTLDETVRGAAFAFMRDYILGTATESAEPVGAANRNGSGSEEVAGDLQTFLASRQLNKPADGVLAIARFLYNLYGTEPFTTKEVGRLATRWA